jgi:hypothetical protein
MKTIETPLTFVLIILCFGFTYKIYNDQVNLDEEKDKIEERKSRTIEVTIPHDGDTKTNTREVVVPSHLKDGTDEGDEITYLWEQKNGEWVDMIGEEESVMSFEAKAGEYEFTVTATDNYKASSSENVIVLINEEPNETPIPIINYGKEESTVAVKKSPEKEAPADVEPVVMDTLAVPAPVAE